MRKLTMFLRQRFEQANILGVLGVANPSSFSPLTDCFDCLLLVFAHDVSRQANSDLIHYIKDGLHIQEVWIDANDLDQWFFNHDRRFIEWMLQGEILIDDHRYVAELKERLERFPVELREKKLISEFSLFLRSYMQSKHYIENGNGLDAYSNILDALIHWARITIIESGVYPEITVWNQLKQFNLGVYKLYEELTSSQESIEQRVKLILLACEFSVMSKMARCCDLLLLILRSRKQPWQVIELVQHEKLRGLRLDIPLLLKKLSRHALLKEVTVDNDILYEAIDVTV